MVRRSTKWRKMLANDNRLSKQELNLILEGAHWAVELDTLLFSIWKEYRSFLPYSSEPDIYAPSRGANLLEKTTRMKGGLLILAAEMMRMDNAGSIIEAAKELPLLTYLMNRGDSKIGVPGESFDQLPVNFLSRIGVGYCVNFFSILNTANMNSTVLRRMITTWRLLWRSYEKANRRSA